MSSLSQSEHWNNQRTRSFCQQTVSIAQNVQALEHFYRRTDALAPLSPTQIVVGSIQHPSTGLYQVWISTNGWDVICLSARRSVVQADADRRAIKVILGSQDIYNEEKVAALFALLAAESDEEPQPLPDRVIRQICEAIQRTVVSRSEAHKWK